MRKMQQPVASMAGAASLILGLSAGAEPSDEALVVRVSAADYAIESRQFDSLGELAAFAEPLVSERFVVIIEECSAYRRGMEVAITLTQLTREHALDLRKAGATRNFQFEPRIVPPDECPWPVNDENVFTLGAFIDEMPSSMALSTVTDSACPVPANFAQDVAESVLRSWDVEPMAWPQLPDWYGIHVRLSCQHAQHLLASVSFVDSKNGDFIEYGTVARGGVDFSDDGWSRWREDFGDYAEVADHFLRRAMHDFLDYNSKSFWYSCGPAGSSGCAMTPP